jgi:hypothetical protein
LRTRETVFIETPAAVETSLIVDRIAARALL